MQQVPVRTFVQVLHGWSNFYATWNSHYFEERVEPNMGIWILRIHMKQSLGVIHITEAGLKQQLPTEMTGYKVVAHARPEPNRGSVIWVRECYLNQMVSVY